jgi:hypothetical protein
MIKFILGFTALFFSTVICKAQFYYKDILSTKQLSVDMVQLKQQKFRKIIIKSFEDDNKESDGFFCEKSINKSYTKTEMITKSYVTGSSIFTSIFNSDGLLLQSVDSSQISSRTSVYTYTTANQLKSIVSTVRSNDDDFKNEITEAHVYFYTDKNLPEKMIKVKNNKDSSTINFVLDDKNNIGIEKDNASGATYYYYYDTKNRLTDVVQLNEFNQKMLPDYIFEYNNSDLITQMTTTEEGGSYYFIWKYYYSNGLRVKEKCYSKEKRLMGTIEYEYK